MASCLAFVWVSWRYCDNTYGCPSCDSAHCVTRSAPLVLCFGRLEFACGVRRMLHRGGSLSGDFFITATRGGKRLIFGADRI